MEQTKWDNGVDSRVLKHIRSTARRLARSGNVLSMDAEDIEQDLSLDLWRRKPAFDPSRASYRTFADRVIAHRVATLATPSPCKTAERAAVPLDQPVGEGSDDSLADTLPDPDDPADLHEHYGLALDVRRFIAGLTPALQRCCTILLTPNVAEAAAEAGLHRSSVYENARRLRKLAVAAGLHEYVIRPRHIAEPAGM